MAENKSPTEATLEAALEKMHDRRVKRRTSIGAIAAAAVAAGVAGISTAAKATNQGAGPPDADILNFALNLE